MSPATEQAALRRRQRKLVAMAGRRAARPRNYLKCGEPIQRCYDAGEHIPVCTCTLDAGHHGPHASHVSRWA